MWRRVLMMAFLLGSVTPARAESYRFVFWYPGGAGSTTLAQPVMDLFAAYLQQHTGQQWQARYFQGLAGGYQYAKTQRPSFGIVSEIVRQRYGSALQLRPLLATRPAPHGKTQEARFLLRSRCPATSTTTLYVAEPTSVAQLRRDFSADTVQGLGTGLKIVETQQLLEMVKGNAAGQCHHVLLNEREWGTMQQLKTPWAQGLQAIKSTRSMPTPRVVQFGTVDPSLATKLRGVLRAMANDPEGRQILAELHLVGFGAIP